MAFTESTASISELRAALVSIREVEGKRRAQDDTRAAALRILEKVQALAHGERRDFEQLKDCQARARDLHLILTEGSSIEIDSDARLLAEGSHPFAQLVLLVERGHELSDDEWQQANDTVSKEMGKALAIAVARNKLFLSSGNDVAEPATKAILDTHQGEQPVLTIEPQPPETPTAVPDQEGEIGLDRENRTINTEIDLANVSTEAPTEIAVSGYEENPAAAQLDVVNTGRCN